ncbi:MAG TPA: hypothetical protein VK631_15235 [Solirubrobacteraceae bacterium]|nr:hypothetical protein [Solirubrobacteraceae bacterium]
MTTVTYDHVSQRAVSLARANEIRSQGSEFRHRVKRLPRADALDHVAAILTSTDLPAWAGAIRTGHLIESVHAIGPGKCDRILRVAGVRGDRKIRDLTDRQRTTIAGLLGCRQHDTRAVLDIIGMEAAA